MVRGAFLAWLFGLALAGGLAAAAGPPPGQAAGPPPSPATGADGGEEFTYRWRLSKFLGVVAGLFFPSQGDGVLRFTPDGGIVEGELLITSEHSAEGEYWRYGSAIEPGSGRTVRAWSSYRWRGKEKSRRGEIDEEGVVDIASGIYRLRRDPPEVARRMEIWSDGKVYPVVVVPMGDEVRKIDGTPVATRHLSVRGVKLPERRHWKGRLELWLAKDEAATPVEILILRSSMAGVHLELTEAP